MDDEAATAHRPSDLERAWGAGFAHEHHPALAQFEPWSGVVEAGYDVNFLGVKTRVAYFSLFEKLADFSSDREIQTSLPVQNEDYFEWIDLAESVLAARGVYRMIELGAGWGKWMVNGAAAARFQGLDYEVTGVEAEPKHFRWMKEHARINGLKRSQTTLLCAAASPTEGDVWFHVGEAADWYGQRIDDSPAEPPPKRSVWRRLLDRPEVVEERRLTGVRGVTLRSLLAKDAIVDLIDADIQGSEADVFEPAADRLDEVVRRVHIGTHSPDNEDRLRRLFRAHGWECHFDFRTGLENDTPYGRLAFEDGVQSWINPRLSDPAREAGGSST